MHVIDGHNLIGKVKGLDLRNIDDEMELLKLLQIYARVKRQKEIEVFFDGAPPGKSGERVIGGIHAHFVVKGKTADSAIRQYLDFLGRRARTAVVVSSDRQVQSNARETGARVVSSEAFADELLAAREEENALSNELKKARQESRRASEPVEPPKPTPPNPGSKMKEWYDLFGIDPSQADKPIEPTGPGYRPAKPKKRYFPGDRDPQPPQPPKKGKKK